MESLHNFLKGRLSQLEDRLNAIKVFKEHKASFIGKQKAVDKITDVAEIKNAIAETEAAIRGIEQWMGWGEIQTPKNKCKKKILTKEQAEKVICRHELQGLNTGRKTGLQRVLYYCRDCKGWHTSTIISDQPDIKNL